MINDPKRYFPPLEEWIYIKAYVNPIASDYVIINYLYPLIEEVYPIIADKWFFVRYFDSNYHIRFRFHFKNKKDSIRGLRMIQSHMSIAVNDGYVHNWVIDGYIREIERYSIDKIIESESLFCINSIFVAKSLRYLADNTFAINCLALWGMHNVLIRFIKDNNERALYCKRMMNAYSKEFNLTKESYISMSKSYRSYRRFLEDIDSIENRISNFPESIKSFQIEYGKALDVLLSNMNETKIHTFNYSSVIHLDVNRLYQYNARKIEMVLYYFLYKKYYSEKFRKK